MNISIVDVYSARRLDNCRNHIMILDVISQIVLLAGCAVN